MKNISINLYRIEELNEVAKRRVLATYRYVNVEFTNWQEPHLDEFIFICSTIGVHIPTDGIDFSGFRTKRTGCTFSSTIDLFHFLKGVARQSWKEYAPLLDFDFESCPCDETLLNAIRMGNIECKVETKIPNPGYWIQLHTVYNAREPWQSGSLDIESEKLNRWILACLNELNSFLYQNLKEQYDFEISDEGVIRVIEENNYYFTEDGQRADWLLAFAIEKNHGR